MNNNHRVRRVRSSALAITAGLSLLVLCAALGAQTPSVPRYKVDPDWPKPLPNKWKMGGVTGLAVDKDDNVWVLNRPNDLTDIELESELTPPLADCCARPPSMIHIDKNGNVIGSFDAPQGHGMDVDNKGFVYIGQDTVRNMIPRPAKSSAKCLACPRRKGAAEVVVVVRPPAFPGAAAPVQWRDFCRNPAAAGVAAATTPKRRRRPRRQPPPSGPSIRRRPR